VPYSNTLSQNERLAVTQIHKIEYDLSTGILTSMTYAKLELQNERLAVTQIHKTEYDLSSQN